VVRSLQPEDVETLCSVAKFDSIGYKRFAKGMTLKQDASAKTAASLVGTESREQAGAGESSQTPAGPVTALAAGAALLLGPDSFPQRPAATRCFHALASPPSPTVPVDPPTVQAARQSPRIPGDSFETSRVALVERAFDQGLKAPSAKTPQGSRAWQLIPFYSGGGGGVGVTTIMGTLARYLSSQGDRILLVDGAPHSTLGFFFNGVASPEGVSSFAPEFPTGNGAEHSGRVDISCRPTDHSDRPQGEDIESWALQSIVQLGAEADRVFVDIASEGAGRAQLCILAAGNPLVIIAPDVRCVSGVTRLMRLFTTQEQALERFITPSFLLNRFDPGVPFHIETLNRLAELLGDRLLTIYIPRLDEISEIAAEGMTIVDFNPASAGAESFYRLAEWIRTSRRANLSTVLGPLAKVPR
jgi:cellulose biosynthesis protein BcsQ